MISMWCVILIACLSAMAVQGDEPTIVKRSEWNAQPTKGPMDTMETPLPRVIIAHTAGVDCTDDGSCALEVRSIQNFQMSQLKFSDIGYHYLIGGNGRVFEGRSPVLSGAFAAPNNIGSLGIAFIGTFVKQAPTQEAINAAKKLLEYAVQKGQLVENYKLLGHRQVSATESPGQALYSLIQQWPHWSSTM